MEESLSVPNIFSAISVPAYSERDLIRNLHDLQSLDEDMYIESFLQFILDCAEVPLHITIDMSYPEALNRCTLNDLAADTFLVYREPSQAPVITGFLQAFLSSNDESKWTEKFTSNILELLGAMLDMETYPRITSCAMFFLIGILFECNCIRTNYRMSQESPTLANFCTRLLGMYDYDLLTDDNYLDIGLKLNYLFLFNSTMFLDGDVENVKHLTALLLIENNQLKGELLKTLDSVLDSSTTPCDVRQGIISELVILRDVIISFCHFCPTSVALGALKLLKSHPLQLLSETEAVDKVYLLMTNANKKVRESAKNFFMESYKGYLPRNTEDPESNDGDTLIKVLDNFVGKYEEAINNLPGILHLLLGDCHLNLMELYLYIVGTKSKIASRISTILVGMMVKKVDESVEASDHLIDFVKICRGALQTLSMLEDKFLYLHLIRNMARLPTSILSHIPKEDVNEMRVNLLGRLMSMEDFSYCDRIWISGLLVQIIKLKGAPGDLMEMLQYQMDNWKGLAACFETTLSSLDSLSLSFGLDVKELHEIAMEELNNDRRIDKIYIIHVKQMCILILAEKGYLTGAEAITEAIFLLRMIEEHCINQDDFMMDQSNLRMVLKIMINLIVGVAAPYYKDALPDQLEYLKKLATPLEVWLARFPDSMASYKLILDFVEFNPNALNFDLSKLWILLLKTPNFRNFIPDITKSCFFNRFVDSETKRKFFIETTAKTIHTMNSAEPPFSWITGATHALQKYLHAEISSNGDLTSYGSSIITDVMIRVLGEFEENLLENIALPRRPDNRLKALDIFLESKGSLWENLILTQGDQTTISKTILKVIKKSPTEMEVKTLRKVFSTWT